MKTAPIRENLKKKFSVRTVLELPNPIELKIFERVQGILSKSLYLVYYNPSRIFFVDLDSSKIEIRAIIFYIKNKGKGLKDLITEKLGFEIFKNLIISGLYPV